jgi:hypothetical protein
MYYIESIIDGILCCKTSPHGDWRPLSQKNLTSKIVQLEEKLTQLMNKLENEHNS